MNSYENGAIESSASACGRPPGAGGTKPGRISLELALDLALCGVMVGSLGFLAQQLQPDYSRATLFGGVAGGALCILWAILARCGIRWGAVGALVTLGAMVCVLARQAVLSWGASASEGSEGRPVMVLMVVLIVFCVGMFATVVRARRGAPL